MRTYVGCYLFNSLLSVNNVFSRERRHPCRRLGDSLAALIFQSTRRQDAGAPRRGASLPGERH